MDFKIIFFTPHMVENTLNLIKWWSFTIVIADNKIFVHFYPFLEHII